MSNLKAPIDIKGVDESIYAGFWKRLGSLFLDFLIILPFTFLIHFANSYSLNVNFFTSILGLLFHFWFSIYLVKKYGGTPGKLIFGIKILKINAGEVSWREALLRQSLPFALYIYVTIVTLLTISKADQNYYLGLGWMQKSSYLINFNPLLSKFYTWANMLLFCSELIVLLFNKRKRALHDFIANTIIVKTKYILALRDSMLHENFK